MFWICTYRFMLRVKFGPIQHTIYGTIITYVLNSLPGWWPAWTSKMINIAVLLHCNHHGPSLLAQFIYIKSTWIGNYIPSKMRDEITNQFPNVNGCKAEVREWINNLIHQFLIGCNYLCMLGLMLIHVSKRGPYVKALTHEHLRISWNQKWI